MSVASTLIKNFTKNNNLNRYILSGIFRVCQIHFTSESSFSDILYVLKVTYRKTSVSSEGHILLVIQILKLHFKWVQEYPQSKPKCFLQTIEVLT